MFLTFATQSQQVVSIPSWLWILLGSLVLIILNILGWLAKQWMASREKKETALSERDELIGDRLGNICTALARLDEKLIRLDERVGSLPCTRGPIPGRVFTDCPDEGGNAVSKTHIILSADKPGNGRDRS